MGECNLGWAALISVCIAFGAGGCGDPPGASAVAPELPNDETCPAGSFPEYSGEAASQCEGRADLDLIEESGSIAGACRSTASAMLFCRFADPCSCGIDYITHDDFNCNSGNPCGNVCCDTTQTCVDGYCADYCPGKRCGAECCSDSEAVCQLTDVGDQTCCNSGIVCGGTCCARRSVCAGEGPDETCCTSGLTCGNECCPNDYDYHCEQGACTYSWD